MPIDVDPPKDTRLPIDGGEAMEGEPEKNVQNIGMRHFAQMIGKGHSGRSDIASRYKQELTDILARKLFTRPPR